VTDDNELAKELLTKLYRQRIWGRHHIREDNLAKGFASHLRNRVMRIAEELRRRGLLVRFPTSHGMQWHANWERIRDIEELISE
jgi:hypothetical protein